MASQETLPSEGNILITVLDQQNICFKFKIKKTTYMRRLMVIYRKRTDNRHEDLRFIFEGRTLKGTDTAVSLEIHNGATIEVYKSLQGGR